MRAAGLEDNTCLGLTLVWAQEARGCVEATPVSLPQLRQDAKERCSRHRGGGPRPEEDMDSSNATGA